MGNSEGSALLDPPIGRLGADVHAVHLVSHIGEIGKCVCADFSCRVRIWELGTLDCVCAPEFYLFIYVLSYLFMSNVV